MTDFSTDAVDQAIEENRYKNQGKILYIVSCVLHNDADSALQIAVDHLNMSPIEAESFVYQLRDLFNDRVLGCIG